MGVNRGKQFEDVVKTSFEKAGFCIDRIHDQTNGYAGSSNICDFTIYYRPNLMYLECKSCYGNTLNFHNISDNQWAGLLKKSHIDGVIAGVMIWFIDVDKTIFVPIQILEGMKQSGQKSVNINKLNEYDYLEVEGQKKRVFFDYNIGKFWMLVKEKWG